MKQFYILAHGHSFDVERFLAPSTLVPSLRWQVGQRSHGMLRANTAGFIIYLAEETIDFQAQQAIALEFIRENEQQLQRCSKFPGMDYFLLSLHFILPLTNATFGFATNTNLDLLAACVGVGLNPSVFVQFDRKAVDSNLLDTQQDDTE
jgi:hypothetical protein